MEQNYDDYFGCDCGRGDPPFCCNTKRDYNTRMRNERRKLPAFRKMASESSSGVDDMTTFQTRMLQRKLAFRDLHTRARFAVKRDLEDAMDGSAGDYYGVARYTNVNVQIEDIKLRIESLNKKKDALERYARALAAADLQLNPEPGQGNRRGPVAVEPIENPQPQRARARARPSWWRRMVRRFRVAIMGQRNQRNAERH